MVSGKILLMWQICSGTILDLSLNIVSMLQEELLTLGLVLEIDQIRLI